MKFLFDLDGTVTKKETLPLIAKKFGLEEEIENLTHKTVRGDIPFVDSFIHRVNLLSNIQVSDVADLLREIELFTNVLRFIQEHKEDCVIVTGNLDVWTHKLLDKIGVQYFTSEAEINEDGTIKSLKKILKKEEVVRSFQSQGHEVCFIGDGNNDAEAMRISDFSIATGLIHEPASSVVDVADYIVYSEDALVRLLECMMGHCKSKRTLVVTAAGVGSRLGLGTTKALVDINGSPLIVKQLENFKDEMDVRIVVGFQFKDVIKTVLEHRDDIIFVYNRDYFHTQVSYSLYLATRHGADYILAWDGDLVLDKDSIHRCLNTQSEFIGCSINISDEPVYAVVENDKVVGFSRNQKTPWEWSGPLYISKQKILATYSKNTFVYQMLEQHLPLPLMEVNAIDIDTVNDLHNVINNKFFS